MWLEGALQNDWSVSQMRKVRWEAIGAPADLKPSDADIIVAELDEDVDSDLDSQLEGAVAGVIEAALGVVHDDDADEEAADEYEESHEGDSESAGVKGSVTAETAPPVRPFENLANLPDDLAESLESFKLAIIRHRLDGWAETSPDDVLASLDALKALVLAPAE
jgi:hypothetical protein